MKNWHRHRSPMGGWGVGSEEPTQMFIMLSYNSCYEIPLSSYRKLTQGLTNFAKEAMEVGGTPRKLQMAQNSIFGQCFLLFFYGPAKNQQAFISEMCPKTLWKCL